MFVVDILVCCWHPTIVAQLFIVVYCCCLTIVAQQFIVDILVCCPRLTVVAQPFIVDILVYCCCEICHVFSLMFMNPQWGFRNTFLTCQCWAVCDTHYHSIFKLFFLWYSKSRNYGHLGQKSQPIRGSLFQVRLVQRITVCFSYCQEVCLSHCLPSHFVQLDFSSILLRYNMIHLTRNESDYHWQFMNCVLSWYDHCS